MTFTEEQRAVLVAHIKHIAEACEAHQRTNPAARRGDIDSARRLADAITAALALADRAAEAERLLAETHRELVEGEPCIVWMNIPDMPGIQQGFYQAEYDERNGGPFTYAPLPRKPDRAAHHNAAQQPEEAQHG